MNSACCCVVEANKLQQKLHKGSRGVCSYVSVIQVIRLPKLLESYVYVFTVRLNPEQKRLGDLMV